MHEIHITDMEQYLRCRRRWYFASPFGLNLQPATLSEPLYLGQAVHIALDAYHSNGNSLEAANSAFDVWTKKRADALGRWTFMDVSSVDLVNEVRTLGAHMLRHYHIWHEEYNLGDAYDVIATEQTFKVPIPVPHGIARGMTYREKRSRGIRLDDGQFVSGTILLAGRFDGIALDKKTGKKWLLEFKTARTLKNVQWVFRGMQGTAYVYAAQRLFGDIEGIMYRVLRKRVPDEPSALQKEHHFSQAKKHKTTFAFHKYMLRKYAQQQGIPADEVFRYNEGMLRRLHGEVEDDGCSNQFFLQKKLRKGQDLLDSVMHSIYIHGMEMASRPVITATPSYMGCMMCPFRSPCDLLNRGMDEAAQAVLDAEFAPRDYWEGEDDDDA